ncbi:15747_t:CDS:2, partial [Dentiscutata heterogama]
IRAMIINKKITTFGDGITNDLDDTYGFREPGDILGDYKDKIIPFLSIAAVNGILYLASRSNKPVPDNYKQMLNTATAGLFSASHTSFSGIFSFQDVNNYPGFSVSSETLLLINQGQLKNMFGKDFEATAKYRAFADILLK